MFLAILSRIRSRIFLGGSGDGNAWIYVDAVDIWEHNKEWIRKRTDISEHFS